MAYRSGDDKKIDQAIDMVSAILEKYPNNSQARRSRANYYLGLDRVHEGLNDLVIYNEINENANTKFHECIMRRNLNMTETLVPCYKKTIALFEKQSKTDITDYFIVRLWLDSNDQKAINGLKAIINQARESNDEFSHYYEQMPKDLFSSDPELVKKLLE